MTIKNHYGYGLRNDEVPFAHKIPQGGNWKSLSEEDQRAFMKGAYGNGGGNTAFLRRYSWDEPCLTITASMMAKATCYLHPGNEGRNLDVPNHHGHLFDNVKPNENFDMKNRQRTWDEPSYTVDGEWRINYLHPGNENRGDTVVKNHDPKHLSDTAVRYVFANAEEGKDDRRSSRINTMDEPCNTVSSVWAKGVPYGLVYPQGKVSEGEPVIKNHDVEKSLLSDKAMEGLQNRAENNFRGYSSIRVQNPDEPSCTITSSTDPSSFLRPTDMERSESTIKPLLDSVPKLESNGYTVTELFAGGGLMRLGLEHAGFETLYATDWDENAIKAHRNNFTTGEIVCADITETDVDSLPDSDVISGGPPCQDYSLAGGGAGEEGERGKLVWKYLEIIQKKQPKAFIFENVKGLITQTHIHTFNALMAKFDEIGYNVAYKVVNSWDYGVAQIRERVFIVGIRRDLGFFYTFPTSEFKETGYRPVLRDAIGDLPEPDETRNHHDRFSKREPNGRREEKTPLNWNEPAPTLCMGGGDPKGHYGTPNAPIHPGVQNHDPKELSEKAMDYLTRDPRHLQKHKPSDMDGPSATIPAVVYKGVPYGLYYPDRESVENHEGHLFDNVGNNPTWDHANRVAEWDKPAPTRTSLDRCDGIHPSDNRPRRFTVRECMRIQSVPDSYVFPDSMSLSAMYRVVGNGVASRVAYHLFKALADQLTNGPAYTEREPQAIAQLSLDLF